LSGEELIKQSLLDAYDKVENTFLEMSRKAYKCGFPMTGRVGAFCLAVVVSDNKLYVAQSGDSNAIIC